MAKAGLLPPRPSCEEKTLPHSECKSTRWISPGVPTVKGKIPLGTGTVPLGNSG